jgi:hypothetical protein
MYFAVAKNHYFAKKGNVQESYEWAEKAKGHYELDSLLTIHYHNDIAKGKWNFMMSQTHIGYKDWQQPEKQTMPELMFLNPSALQVRTENDGCIAFEAQNFSKKNENNKIRWEIIPDFGKTKSGVMTYPQNIEIQANDNIYLEYAFENKTVGDVAIHVLLAPTLNFNTNKGLRYALSIDSGKETIINFNGHYRGELGEWQARSIIESVTKMHIDKAGKHNLRVRILDNGIIFEKIMLNFGGLKPSYLGVPEKNER